MIGLWDGELDYLFERRLESAIGKIRPRGDSGDADRRHAPITSLNDLTGLRKSNI